MSKDLEIKRYLVTELYPQAKYQAGVLREDIETVLLAAGYEKVHTISSSPTWWNRLRAYPKTKKLADQLTRPSILFFHFPLRSRVNRYLFTILKRPAIKTIAYIHDFEGLRDGNRALFQKELELLKFFTVIIAQNRRMKELIEKETGHTKVIELEIYDYLQTTEPIEQASPNKPVIFAGNLQKASFVSQLAGLMGLQFSVYGETAPLLTENVRYKGKEDPRILPSVIAKEGSYGLVWDGSSIESGKDEGAYLRINTPHKLALYIMAGLPPIVWKESAMADWVQAQEIGIAISSLYELKERLEKITTAEYENFQNRMKELRHKMNDGYFLRKAIQKAEEMLA